MRPFTVLGVLRWANTLFEVVIPHQIPPLIIFLTYLQEFFFVTLRLRRSRSFECFKVAILRQIPRLVIFLTYLANVFFCQIVPAKKHCNSRFVQRRQTYHARR